MKRCLLVMVAACSGGAKPAPTEQPPATAQPAAQAGPKTDADLSALNQRVVDVLVRMGHDVEGKTCTDSAAALEAALPDYAAVQAEIAKLTGAERERFKQVFVDGGFDDKIDTASTGVWNAAKRCQGDSAMEAAMKHLGEAETGGTGGGSTTGP
jgi:hypothetical protein